MEDDRAQKRRRIDPRPVEHSDQADTNPTAAVPRKLTGPQDDQDAAGNRTASDSDDYTSDSSDGSSSPGSSDAEDDPTETGSAPPHLAAGIGPDLQARLAAFLPLMQAANQDLEILRSRGQLRERILDDATDDEHHIEMDLGLGVFEELPAAEYDDSDSSEDDDSGSVTVDTSTTIPTKNDVNPDAPRPSRDDQVLRKLMGQPRAKQKAGIEELPEAG